MFEMVTGSHPGDDEAELTPIFHALTRPAPDADAGLRRDPLAAPLPGSAPSPAALRAVRSGDPAEPDRTAAPGADPHRPVMSPPSAHHVGAHRALDGPMSGQARGGRHRALRAVTFPDR